MRQKVATGQQELGRKFIRERIEWVPDVLLLFIRIDKVLGAKTEFHFTCVEIRFHSLLLRTLGMGQKKNEIQNRCTHTK